MHIHLTLTEAARIALAEGPVSTGRDGPSFAEVLSASAPDPEPDKSPTGEVDQTPTSEEPTSEDQIDRGAASPVADQEVKPSQTAAWVPTQGDRALAQPADAVPPENKRRTVKPASAEGTSSQFTRLTAPMEHAGGRTASGEMSPADPSGLPVGERRISADRSIPDPHPTDRSNRLGEPGKNSSPDAPSPQPRGEALISDGTTAQRIAAAPSQAVPPPVVTSNPTSHRPSVTSLPAEAPTSDDALRPMTMLQRAGPAGDGVMVPRSSQHEPPPVTPRPDIAEGTRTHSEQPGKPVPPPSRDVLHHRPHQAPAALSEQSPGTARIGPLTSPSATRSDVVTPDGPPTKAALSHRETAHNPIPEKGAPALPQTPSASAPKEATQSKPTGAAIALNREGQTHAVHGQVSASPADGSYRPPQDAPSAPVVRAAPSYPVTPPIPTESGPRFDARNPLPAPDVRDMVPQPHKALVTGMPVASTEGVAVSPLPQRHEGATRFETIRAPGKVVTDQTISASSSTSTPLPAAAPTAVRPSAEPSHRNGTIPAKADPNTTPASPAPAPLSDSAPRIVPQQQIAQLSALIPGALPKKEDVPPPIRSDVIWPDAKPAMRSGPVRPDPSTARPLTPTVGSPPNPAGDAVRPIFGDAVMIDHAPDMSVAPAFSADAPVLSQPAVAARPILQQIMENLPRLPDKPVEISLNPDELGRVRIAVTSQDSGIVVSIHAERPETIDLLRRNIDMLAQEYRDLGYTDIAFDFAQQGGQGQAGSDGTASSDGPFLHADEGDHPQPEPAMLSSDGLDIRI